MRSLLIYDKANFIANKIEEVKGITSTPWVFIADASDGLIEKLHIGDIVSITVNEQERYELQSTVAPLIEATDIMLLCDPEAWCKENGFAYRIVEFQEEQPAIKATNLSKVMKEFEATLPELLENFLANGQYTHDEEEFSKSNTAPQVIDLGTAEFELHGNEITCIGVGISLDGCTKLTDRIMDVWEHIAREHGLTDQPEK
jgi:hypothetical protein